MRLIDQVRAGARMHWPNIAGAPTLMEASAGGELLRMISEAEVLYADDPVAEIFNGNHGFFEYDGVRSPYPLLWVEGITTHDVPFPRLASLWTEHEVKIGEAFEEVARVMQWAARTAGEDAMVDQDSEWAAVTVLYQVHAFAGERRRTGKYLYDGSAIVGVTEEGKPQGFVLLVRGQDPALQVLLDTHVTAGAFTISLANCRNVRMVRPPISPDQEKLNRAHERRLGVPVSRYYVLEIDPGREPARPSVPTGEGTQKAMHICRGHFKTYTPEAPLFGSLTGRWWWPAHVRGDQRFGTVAKDYRIKTKGAGG